MSKRAEFKRQQKEAEKHAKSKLPAPLNVSNYTAEQIASATGTKIEYLMIWKNAREEEMRKAAALEAQEKLYKAEDYIAVANILITVYAIKMSRKSREHTKDLIHRMLDNLNAAKGYVERVGVDKAYEYAHRDFEIELEFDSMDLNKEFGFEEYDFREEGFENRSSLEIWNAAWENAKDFSNIINTCVICGTLKSPEFGFSNADIDKLIKLSNSMADEAKKASDGVTKLIEEFEKNTGLSIGERNKKLVRMYGL